MHVPACECNSVGAQDNNCDLNTGKCTCRDNVYGKRCDECEPGYWNFPNCQQCNCNGHADTCDQKTGTCIDCRDLTAGHGCDRYDIMLHPNRARGVDQLSTLMFSEWVSCGGEKILRLTESLGTIFVILVSYGYPSPSTYLDKSSFERAFK